MHVWKFTLNVWNDPKLFMSLFKFFFQMIACCSMRFNNVNVYLKFNLTSQEIIFNSNSNIFQKVKSKHANMI